MRFEALGWPPITTISYKINATEIDETYNVFVSYVTTSNMCYTVQDSSAVKVPQCERVSKQVQQQFNCSLTNYVKFKVIPGSLLKMLCTSIQARNRFGQTFSKMELWNLSDLGMFRVFKLSSLLIQWNTVVPV